MYATVLSELVVTGYQLWYIRDIADFKQMFVNVPKYLLAGIVMFIPVFAMSNLVKTSILSIGSEVVLGVIIYMIMIVLLKPTSLAQVTAMVKQKFNK